MKGAHAVGISEPPIDEARLADAPARRRIRQDLDTSLLCLAGAGAGKTHALVARMVACVHAGSDVAQMAAITFTRKAAGQMRGRFLLALQAAAAAAEQEGAGPASARAAARLHVAVARVDQCFIGTIHAFCARLLRERPVEAGLPPDFREVEEREEVWWARDAWDRFLAARAEAGDERLLALEDTGLTAELFYRFYLQRCQYSDLPLKPTAAPRPDLEAAVATACALVLQVTAQIPEPLPEGRHDGLMEVVLRLRRVAELGGPVSDAEREALLRSLASRSGTEPTLKCWGERGSPGQALARVLKREVLPALREQVIGPTLAAWRRHVYALTASLVDEAMTFYRQHRRAAAALTFNDLLEDTAALLRRRPDVRAAFRQRLRRLFVDEFQDTDPLQAEIVMQLAGAGAEADWRALWPRPGSLFLVGDEKQSIYRFRRADVDTFRWVRECLRASGGAEVELTTCFRSRPQVTGWVNATFETLFDSHDPRYQAAFARLEAPRPGCAGAGVYRLRCRVADGGDRAAHVADEAARIADFIAAALRGDTPLNGDQAVLGARAEPGDFLLLTRSRRYLGAYGRALEARGIPYDITGAGSLRDSAELRAVVDALETVLRGDDPVPLLATLRGPVAGLGDDELYRLRRAGWRFDWRAELPAEVPEPLRARVASVLAGLRRLHDEVRRRPLAAALERWLEATGLLAVAAAGDGGSSRAGTLLRVLALVRDAQARRGLDWGQIAAELRDLLDDERMRVEEMTLEVGRADVVRVMNLHQAKGLEARVVFLVDPTDTAAAQHGVEVHVARTGDRPHLSLAVTRPLAHGTLVLAEPEGWQADAEEEARYLAAEGLRLVYVAATRAADVLVVGVTGRSRGAWAVLEAALANAPDLPPPTTSLAPAPAAAPPPDAEALSAARRARWEQAVRPGYSLERATVDDVEALLQEEADETGRGRTYGTVVHRLLEHEVRGRLAHLDGVQLRACVRSMLQEAGLDDPDLEAASLVSLTAFRQGPLAAEVAAAGDEVWAEVPVAEVLPGGPGTAGPMLRRGVIDLVYRVAGGGWKIVDTKTHRELTEALCQAYARQVGRYAAHWEAVRREPVVERGLWLASGDGRDRYLKL